MASAKRGQRAADTWRAELMQRALRKLLQECGGILETVIVEDTDRLQADAEAGNTRAQNMMIRLSDLLQKIRCSDGDSLVCCPRCESPILGRGFAVALVGSAKDRSRTGLSMAFCRTCAPDTPTAQARVAEHLARMGLVQQAPALEHMLPKGRA